MEIAYQPTLYSAMPAEYAINLYHNDPWGYTERQDIVRLLRQQLFRIDRLRKKFTFEIGARVETYPPRGNKELVPEVISLLHGHGHRVLINTYYPQRRDFGLLRPGDVYAISIQSVDADARRYEDADIPLPSQRVGAMFDAAEKSGCKTLLVINPFRTAGFTVGAISAIRADMYAVRGLRGKSMPDFVRQEIIEAAGGRRVMFDDRPEEP